MGKVMVIFDTQADFDAAHEEAKERQWGPSKESIPRRKSDNLPFPQFKSTELWVPQANLDGADKRLAVVLDDWRVKFHQASLKGHRCIQLEDVRFGRKGDPDAMTREVFAYTQKEQEALAEDKPVDVKRRKAGDVPPPVPDTEMEVPEPPVRPVRAAAPVRGTGRP